MLPAGSGCALMVNSLNYEHKKKNSVDNALQMICKIRKLNFNVMKVTCLDLDDNVNFLYSFLGVNYGFLADIDKESEFLRCLGHYRFTIYSMYKIMILNNYSFKLSIP